MIAIKSDNVYLRRFQMKITKITSDSLNFAYFKNETRSYVELIMITMKYSTEGIAVWCVLSRFSLSAHMA